MNRNLELVNKQKLFLEEMSKPGGGRVTLVSLYNTENTSIRYFIPMLRNAGHEVQVIYFWDYYVNDAVHHPPEDEEAFLNLIKSFDPHLVAFSVGSSTFYQVAEQLTQKVKANSEAFVLWGGVHAMVTPDQGIEHADAVCLGEGELVLLELIHALLQKNDVSKIKNLWVKTPEGIMKNPARPPIEDLDILPLPDFSDHMKYFIQNGVEKGDPHGYVTWQYYAQASRGCPFSCSFCMNSILKPIFSGRCLRRKSVDNIIEELIYVKQALPNIGSFFFIDEVFMIDDDWIMEFAEKYPVRVGLPFGIYNTPGLVEDKYLRVLKRAGLFEVEIGIQSGSEKIRREVFHRKTTNAEILSASRATHRYGIDLKFDLIWDNPFESENDKRQLFDLLLKIPPPFEFSSFSLVWFPRVPITQMALDQGIIGPEDIEDRKNKAFEQWSVTLDYPRPKDELFWISICMLTGKPWIPSHFIRWLSRQEFIRQNPKILHPLIRVNTIIRWILKGIPVLIRGQVPWAIIRKRWRFMVKAVK